MRYAVVDPAGRVLRHGECTDADLERQALFPGETAVWVPPAVIDPEALIWDHATQDFIQT